MCDPCFPDPCFPGMCDPYMCPPYGQLYSGPRYLVRSDHSSELIKYRTTSTPYWITIYRNNLCGRKTSVLNITPTNVPNNTNNTTALTVSLDASVAECRPNFVIVTVTVSGHNSSNQYVVKSYEKYVEIHAHLPLNVVVPFENNDHYDFTSDGSIPPSASAEITIDWYARRCW